MSLTEFGDLTLTQYNGLAHGMDANTRPEKHSSDIGGDPQSDDDHRAWARKMAGKG